MFGINFIDTIQNKHWLKLLWEKCVNLLVNKTKQLLLKWKKHLHHCYNHISWFLHSFAKGLHSVLCVLVHTARGTIGCPIRLQWISYLRHKVSGPHNNWKPTMKAGYAEVALFVGLLVCFVRVGFFCGLVVLLSFFFLCFVLFSLSNTCYGEYSKQAVNTCRTLSNLQRLCTFTFKDPWHKTLMIFFFLLSKI